MLSSGWPVVELTPLVRTNDTAAWEHAPAEADDTIPQTQIFSCMKRLMNLGMLDICSQILTTGIIPNATYMLLPVLLACGRSGNELSLVVCQCEPILVELRSLLAPHTLGNEARDWEIHFQVLKVIRVLLQTGRNILDIFEARGNIDIIFRCNASCLYSQFRDLC